jgi:ABC-type sugar transport system ATPase subunit
MAAVSLKNLRKSYNGKTDVLAGIDLDIAHGEFVVLVGPSGCGKSTLLRLLCGLESATDGTIEIAGRTVNHLPPAERGIAMVFQSYALYPHMTVYKNMAFGLKVAGATREQIEARIQKAARILEIDGLLQRYPRELSGGQRQRVAIGRAIVREPQLFLFDEPLSNLDAALRVQTRIEIARLHRRLDATIVYVTHDQVEAMTLGDKIVVLHEGRLQQVGSPLELYQHPRNQFVAGFIGSPKMNLLPGVVLQAAADGVTVKLDSGPTIRAAVDGRDSATGERVMLGLRAEHAHEGNARSQRFAGRIVMVEHLGEANMLHIVLDGGSDVVLRGDGSRHVQVGSHIVFSAEPADFHLFDEQGLAMRRLQPGNLLSSGRVVLDTEGSSA